LFSLADVSPPEPEPERQLNESHVRRMAAQHPAYCSVKKIPSQQRFGNEIESISRLILAHDVVIFRALFLTVI